ncbi:tyrosine--tRNA ligase, partial [Crocinitomicaceae bacterium]|nr:tyrosine--tRNA ligase [Crocinitomicaceae bacterium]
KANSISVNKEKVNDQCSLSESDLINQKYILLGKGKKTNFILRLEA